MGKLIDLTARFIGERSPLDLSAGVVDAGLILAVDEMEQLVHASAREIAIELVRRTRVMVCVDEHEDEYGRGFYSIYTSEV